MRLVASSQPASADTAVMLCCDAGYLPFAALAATQIAALHPARSFDICICSDTALKLPEALTGAGIRMCHIETGGAFAGLRLDARRTESAYLRLTLPQLFEDTYRRILYLDSDVFVQGGDFAALLDTDMGGHVLAAVRDNIQWRTPHRLPTQFKRFGWPTAPYFNSGVLLIDTQRFRDRNLLQDSIAFGRTHKDILIGHDQTLLNCLMRGDWHELPPWWNWQYTWASRLTEAMVGAHIVHFIGKTKPWNDPKGDLPPRFTDGYTHFLHQHFPDRSTTTGPDPIWRDAARVRKVLVKHLLSYRRMTRYLNRFEKDGT